MDRKTVIIVLALALIVAFFLPLVSVGGTGMSAFDLVKSKMPGWEKYLYLIFPICGLLLLLGALNNNYVVPQSLLTWLPFITVLFIILLYPIIQGAKIDAVFKRIGSNYGVGWWVTIVASTILAFYNPRR